MAQSESRNLRIGELEGVIVSPRPEVLGHQEDTDASLRDQRPGVGGGREEKREGEREFMDSFLCLFVYLDLQLTLSLPLCFCLCLSVCLCLFVCLSLYLVKTSLFLTHLFKFQFLLKKYLEIVFYQLLLILSN